MCSQHSKWVKCTEGIGSKYGYEAMSFWVKMTTAVETPGNYLEHITLEKKN